MSELWCPFLQPGVNMMRKSLMALCLVPFFAFASNYDLNGTWPVIGHDQENSGVTHSNNGINRQNASTLVKDWTFVKLTEQGVNATPVISDGKVFIANNTGHVYALDELTGTIIWSQTLVASDRANAPENFAVSPTITKDKVFVGASHMFALDKATGAILWDTPIYTLGNYLTESAANPMVAGKNVIIGVNFGNSFIIPPGGHYTGEFGRIMAFDQDTGVISWVLNTSQPPFGPGASSFHGWC